MVLRVNQELVENKHKVNNLEKKQPERVSKLRAEIEAWDQAHPRVEGKEETLSDDDNQDRILSTAERLGSRILWKNHYWKEFNGFCGAFVDPWGNTLVLWTKGGPDPKIPAGWTNE